MTKAERIRLGEIDTAIEDGKELAKKELMPKILEAKAREKEAKAREEEAKQLLKTAIIQFQNLGLDVDKIASILNKSVVEIKGILENN